MSLDMGVGQSNKKRLVRYHALAVDCIATDRLWIPAVKIQQAKCSTSNEIHTSDVNSWLGK